MYCIVLYRIVSGDVFAHHQAHITITTASGIVLFVVKILYCVIWFRAMCCVVLYCIVLFRAMFSPIIRSISL